MSAKQGSGKRKEAVREWLIANGSTWVHDEDSLIDLLAAYRRDSLIAELEALAREMCWPADNCHERGIHTLACDKIRRRLEQLKEEG